MRFHTGLGYTVSLLFRNQRKSVRSTRPVPYQSRLTERCTSPKREDQGSNPWTGAVEGRIGVLMRFEPVDGVLIPSCKSSTLLPSSDTS